MNLIKLPLLWFLAVFGHANAQRNPKPLHEWDFHQDCKRGDGGAVCFGIKDHRNVTIKAPGSLLGGASCTVNCTKGVSIKAPTTSSALDVCYTGQYVNISSLGMWGGAVESYLKFGHIFNGPLQRVYDFSRPGT